MTNTQVTMVRIYTTEGHKVEAKILDYLRHDIKIRGVTVFRGITGFGHSGEMHDSKLLYLSMDLPIVIEFFDTPDKAQQAIEHLTPLLGESPIVSWQAVTH